MRARLEQLRGEGLAQIAAASTAEELERAELALLGRSGRLTAMLREVGALPAEQKPEAGRLANEVKEILLAALAETRSALDAAGLTAELSGAGLDPTLPGGPAPAGAAHPVLAVARQLEDLFTSMGFVIWDGPEVETEEHNFDALNIPRDHPARDAQDTIWCVESPGQPRLCLRTHTSPVQIRALRELGAPLRVVAPGRVFRQEAQDATHEHTFHQMEGLVVDRGVGVPHMLHAMHTLIEGVFGRPLETRLRPGFFPFVEPGFELDARCPFCTAGCRVCKQSRWIELMPGGLVHPNVLRACGVNPDEYSGYAFGLGLSRIAMLRWGIDDIRWMMSGDLRFLEQFPA
jgi:phenylalanyl-tRNA synthetase alpha chain